MPWEVIIKNAYPEYELYCKNVLHTNLCTPSIEEIISWYRFIEWQQKNGFLYEYYQVSTNLA